VDQCERWVQLEEGEEEMEWSEQEQEEARKRREAPEAPQRRHDARGLLDEATEKLWSAGELELFDRVYEAMGS
jgi:hypothetical protein